EWLKAVQGWEEAFGTWAHRLGSYVPRADTRQRVSSYIRSLLGEVERRNSWQLAEYADHTTPYAFQHVLGRANWEVEGVRDEVRTSIYEQLRATDDALVIDETGFLKQGKHSAGVQRQYSGTAGRVENCQIGVFLGYTSAHGHSLIDRELYLPKEWFNDPARCDRAGIPTEVVFQTKPQLAEVMLRRAFDHGIQARWVVGDAVYGDNRGLRGFLEAREQGYVLAVSGKEYVWRGVSQIAIRDLITQHLPPPAQWQRLSAGEGSQGPPLYEWAYLSIHRPLQPGWERGVLLRRSLDPSPQITAYVVFAPVGTAVAALAMAAGQRWTIETGFRETKDQLGLDQYEVRSWTGWYRHMTLVLAAQAFLAALQQQSKKKREPPLKTVCRV
ncbi:MAG TPA: IS701 family transposase, partial [Candidatus Competibacteraceae bacterium]|nr:IS701 family transposase [Candidatus Competibacteraceae bacterium]